MLNLNPVLCRFYESGNLSWEHMLSFRVCVLLGVLEVLAASLMLAGQFVVFRSWRTKLLMVMLWSRRLTADGILNQRRQHVAGTSAKYAPIYPA